METLRVTSTTAIPVARTYRIDSIDLLRGLVMIIMALDHTRDFFHISALVADPLNVNTSPTEVFFTRWITHFCAPVFVFLSGTSAFLQSLRKSKRDLGSFLLKRGIWLIIAELTLVSFGLTFDITFSFIILQVIWAIGVSMVLLSFLIWLPFRWLLALGLFIVFGHNLLDFWERQQTSTPLAYKFLHQQIFYPLGNGRVLGILYPFLPWTGIMILGYCFGKLYTSSDDIKKRTRMTAIAGWAVIGIFILLRAVNVYGDPQPWTVQDTTWKTILSFINTQKYPPSLLFTCMTLGPALLFLAYAGKAKNRLNSIITVYGRVPFFYFLLHFYLIHLVAVFVFLSRGHTWAEGVRGAPGLPFKFLVPGEGFNLWIVYAIWMAIVIALYPVCKWYSEVKKRNKSWWLSYV